MNGGTNVKRILIILLVLLLTIPCASAECTLNDLLQMTPEPCVGSIGGEWAILALARGECSVPEGYYEGYLNNVEAELQVCGGELHPVKRTEYARVALALAALGEDPANFRGYDLIAPLMDVDSVKIQGNNGPIWALIALDSIDAQNLDTAREALLKEILAAQNEDGGYAIAVGQSSNADMTAMALTALSTHRDEDGVQDCVERALAWLKKTDLESCESCAQVMVAYCALGMNDEAANVRNAMEEYAVEGGYCHTLDEPERNAMSSEQAAYAIVAYERMCDGKNTLFDMRDVQ